MNRWLPSVAALLMSFGSGFAADLSVVDRTIAKQPAYVGKPGYCLLVFGAEAKDRVWLVRDGDTLYVDKNGNGDLTDAGEKVAAEKSNANTAFHVGKIRIGKREHRNLTIRASRLSAYSDGVAADPVARAALQKDKDVDCISLNAEIDVPGLKGDGDDGRVSVMARFDSRGPLLFADAPATAPVLHLGGPLQLSSESARPTLYRNVVHDLMLAIGTPGIGPGSFTHVGYEKLIPDEVFIVVEATFSPNKPGGPPVERRFELKDRC